MLKFCLLLEFSDYKILCVRDFNRTNREVERLKEDAKKFDNQVKDQKKECEKAVAKESELKNECLNVSAECKKSLKGCILNSTELKNEKDNCVLESVNLTRILKDCKDERDRLQISEGQCSEDLKNNREELAQCRTRVADLEGHHKDRLDEMSEDFRMVSEASHCLKQCGGLTAVGEKYVCMRTKMLPNVCSVGAKGEMSLNKVEPCVLLGDRTLRELDWGKFVSNNPSVGILLICGLILSANGILLTCLWVVICVKWRREKKLKLSRKWTSQPRIFGNTLENPGYREDSTGVDDSGRPTGARPKTTAARKTVKEVKTGQQRIEAASSSKPPADGFVRSTLMSTARGKVLSFETVSKL
jgi:hypothetical protein